MFGKGIAKLIKKAGGSAAVQKAGSSLAQKGATAGIKYATENKDMLIGKARKVVGFEKGGVIVLKRAGAVKGKAPRKKRKAKK